MIFYLIKALLLGNDIFAKERLAAMWSKTLSYSMPTLYYNIQHSAYFIIQKGCTSFDHAYSRRSCEFVSLCVDQISLYITLTQFTLEKTLEVNKSKSK